MPRWANPKLKYGLGISFALPNLVDDRNKEVRVPEQAERIISLSPSITEILFELGLGDKVVGVTPFCVRPAEAAKKKKVASYGYASIEQFEKLKPDIILTVTGYQNAVADSLASHFPTFSFRLPSSLAGVIDLVTKVGVVTREEENGRRLERSLMGEVSKLKIGREKSVYFECDLGGPISFGSLSYITDVLSFMNFKSVYSNSPVEWLNPDLNYVREQDPEYVILEPKMFSKRDMGIVDKLVSARGWKDISAYRNHRIFLTPGRYDFFAHHGPSLIREVLPWLQKLESS
jgi:ABC-type Fe3+-hydroxamate transport system substrate-binding protein